MDSTTAGPTRHLSWAVESGAAATTAVGPGLAYDTLVDGDLAVTTDYRSVLCEILTRRFNASTSTVFPNFTPETVGVMA